ncbi:MAG: OmpA family protein [Chitinophagaceae bacterium]|nr:OmpA family protein [Chitinophagaceae bacterium]
MVSKKYMLLAGIFCLMASYSFAQVKTAGSYDPSDSSVVPAKRMPQHTEFLNGTNNFPAKPRNQWEIGAKAGAFTISGDVPAIFPTLGWGLHVRKALGYVFSLRLEYMNGTGKGLGWRQTENINKNTPWMAAGYIDPYAPGGDAVYMNYKTNVQELSLQGIFTLNNVRFHKSKTGFNFYGIAGFGGTIYDAKLDLLNGNGNTYQSDFASIPQGTHKSRKDTRKALKDVLDGKYETDAQNHGDRRPKLFGSTFRPSATFGFGMAFKLSNRFNLALEDRITIVKDDLLDGQQWQEHPGGNAALSPDADSYNFLSLGLNYNIGAKSVEPLWWLNPLDYAYSEIRNPRLMKLPKPVLDDSDGDGVPDQFDLEQTPAGVPVDTRGVSRDTDGDGVPDYKDKELITPTHCQPVDADGVGKCPCPDESCFEGYRKANDCATTLGPLPSVTFRNNSNALTDDAKAVLATVASRMRNNPECKVAVVGYCSSNKKEQQLSWDHVNKVISYLVEEQGVSADRFIFNYGNEGGDCNTVDLRGANEGEDGPNTVAPPHPNLRKK